MDIKTILEEQIKSLNKQIINESHNAEGINALVMAQMQMIQMYRSFLKKGGKSCNQPTRR